MPLAVVALVAVGCVALAFYVIVRAGVRQDECRCGIERCLCRADKELMKETRTITALALAQQEVLLGDGLVAFDKQGRALGVVAPRSGNTSGPRYDALLPLGATQFNAAIKDPARFTVAYPSSSDDTLAAVMAEAADPSHVVAEKLLAPVEAENASVVDFLKDTLAGTATIEEPFAPAVAEPAVAEPEPQPKTKTYTGNRRAKATAGS